MSSKITYDDRPSISPISYRLPNETPYKGCKGFDDYALTMTS